MLFYDEKFDAAKAAQVLRQTRAGFLPHEYCGQHAECPFEASAVDMWATENPTFATELEKARRAGADALHGHCVKIADDEGLKADQKKIQIEARMKAAALWHPERYGPKADKEPSGGVNALVNLNYGDLNPDQQKQVDKFFGTDDD